MLCFRRRQHGGVGWVPPPLPHTRFGGEQCAFRCQDPKVKGPPQARARGRAGKVVRGPSPQHTPHGTLGPSPSLPPAAAPFFLMADTCGVHRAPLREHLRTTLRGAPRAEDRGAGCRVPWLRPVVSDLPSTLRGSASPSPARPPRPGHPGPAFCSQTSPPN